MKSALSLSRGVIRLIQAAATSHHQANSALK